MYMCVCVYTFKSYTDMYKQCVARVYADNQRCNTASSSYGVSTSTLHTEDMTLKQSVAFSRVSEGFWGGERRVAHTVPHTHTQCTTHMHTPSQSPHTSLSSLSVAPHRVLSMGVGLA